ncbi:hypothetical protein D9758_017361 [Tetrapyrgos nigripes]|uniref:Uncharacterized protein n=1 Tax=Tetrapyrgos nigripes TaxID=182062 RepID=A0A8H5FFJ8_9AGAR|nr:hypothetical protein D9758_017361 [Tetrapyrgos nigripes]
MKRDNYLIYGTFTNKSLEKRETDDDLSHSTQTLTPTTSTLVIIRDDDDADDLIPFVLIPSTAAAETKMFCQKQVIGCFKTLEKWGDRLTGAAGPFFVTFAIVLISMGALSFFDIVYPTLSYKLLTGPLCILIALNLFTHYYLVCTTPPGFVDAEPMQSATTFPQSWTWARPRKAKSRAANGYRPLETVDAEEGSLEEAGLDEWNITKADMTKCRKCTAMRPECKPSSPFPASANSTQLNSRLCRDKPMRWDIQRETFYSVYGLPLALHSPLRPPGISLIFRGVGVEK